MTIYEERKSGDFDEAEIRFFLEQGHGSDFLFEIEVVRRLAKNGFQIHHAQHYEDSVTNKLREFDIRAVKCIHSEMFGDVAIGLAVECKNISKKSPIVVYTAEKQEHENFLEVLRFGERGHPEPAGYQTDRLTNCNIYNQLVVGRKIEQVKRVVSDRKNEEDHYSTRDNSVSTRWHQALSSLVDMVPDLHGFDVPQRAWRAFFPVLVVPDDTLWWVGYNGAGKMEYPPELCDEIVLHVNHFIPGDHFNDSLQISHLHIVTLGGLLDLVRSIETLTAASVYEGEISFRPA